MRAAETGPAPCRPSARYGRPYRLKTTELKTSGRCPRLSGATRSPKRCAPAVCTADHEGRVGTARASAHRFVRIGRWIEGTAVVSAIEQCGVTIGTVRRPKDSRDLAVTTAIARNPMTMWARGALMRYAARLPRPPWRSALRCRRRVRWPPRHPRSFPRGRSPCS